MEIKLATSDKEKEDLDQLLWEVLWKRLGFDHNIRETFKLETRQIELIAVQDRVVIGGLVANWLPDSELEIRHIAVAADSQENSVGRHLFRELISMIKSNNSIKIKSWARNTSIGFFAHLGFVATGELLEHPQFTKHEITFEQVVLNQ
ncbi:GNAT family N-acetyltransferase [Chloroflexota bacterium]